MSDQCGRCELRGKLHDCLREDCFQHDNWFAFALQEQLAAKGKEIEQLKTEKEIIRISCNCCEYRIAETAYREVESHLQKEIKRLKELNDKFMWQVRDTCARAEKAENLVAKYKNYYEVTANELTEINKQLKQVEAENAAFRERLRPVEEVYKEHEVWAREWLSTAPVSSRSRMLEFWQAICKAMEGK